MRHSDRLHAILIATRQTYQRGEIDCYQIQAIARRVGRLQRVLTVRARRLRERERNRLYLERTLEGLRRGFQTGRVAAFDTGFDPHTSALEELGIAEYQGGLVHTVTYRLPIRADRPHEAWFGPICQIDTADELREIARHVYDRADICVFHTAHSDLEVLAIQGSKEKHADIMVLDQIERQSNYSRSLARMFTSYNSGMEIVGHHESGNDAYRTLNIARIMAETFDIETILRRRRPIAFDLPPSSGKARKRLMANILHEHEHS